MAGVGDADALDATLHFPGRQVATRAAVSANRRKVAHAQAKAGVSAPRRGSFSAGADGTLRRLN